VIARIGQLSLVVAILAAAAPDAREQRPAPAVRPAPAPRPAKSTLKAEQALPLTCAQAWIASGKRYPDMFAVVTTLAKVSLANRDLTLPNTREAGLEAGKGIADDCKADPDALLFAIVDKHVRRVAAPSGP